MKRVGVVLFTVFSVLFLIAVGVATLLLFGEEDAEPSPTPLAASETPTPAPTEPPRASLTPATAQPTRTPRPTATPAATATPQAAGATLDLIDAEPGEGLAELGRAPLSAARRFSPDARPPGALGALALGRYQTNQPPLAPRDRRERSILRPTRTPS